MTATMQCNKKEMNRLKRRFLKEGFVVTIKRSGETYWITAA